jgi:hypothetical protein
MSDACIRISAFLNDAGGHGLRSGLRCVDEYTHLVSDLVQLELQKGATGSLPLQKMTDASRLLRRMAELQVTAQ